MSPLTQGRAGSCLLCLLSWLATKGSCLLRIDGLQTEGFTTVSTHTRPVPGCCRLSFCLSVFLFKDNCMSDLSHIKGSSAKVKHMAVVCVLSTYQIRIKCKTFAALEWPSDRGVLTLTVSGGPEFGPGSAALEFEFNVVLCPQRSYGLLGTGSSGRPPRLSHSSWTLYRDQRYPLSPRLVEKEYRTERPVPRTGTKSLSHQCQRLAAHVKNSQIVGNGKRDGDVFLDCLVEMNRQVNPHCITSGQPQNTTYIDRIE